MARERTGCYRLPTRHNVTVGSCKLAPSFGNSRPVPYCFTVLSRTTTTTRSTHYRRLAIHRPPRAESILSQLSSLPPSQYRQNLSISPQSAPLSLACSVFSNTPLIRLYHFHTTTQPGACPPRKALKFRRQSLFQIPASTAPLDPIVSPLLRRDSSKPFCPSSLLTPQTAVGCPPKLPPQTLPVCTHFYRPLLQMDTPSKVTLQV